MSGDIEIAIGITAHTIHAEIRKLDQQPFIRDRTAVRKVIGPDLTLYRFIDIECFSSGLTSMPLVVPISFRADAHYHQY